MTTRANVGGVREEDGSFVLRLFGSFEDCLAEAVALSQWGRFHTPVQHRSRNGWIVLDRETGDVYDAAGFVRGYKVDLEELHDAVQ